jgi:hypothetical protein
VQIFPKDGKPYCKESFIELFCEKCGGCSKAITGGYLNAMSKKWHKECLVCFVCENPLAGQVRCIAVASIAHHRSPSMLFCSCVYELGSPCALSILASLWLNFRCQHDRSSKLLLESKLHPRSIMRPPTSHAPTHIACAK